MSTFDELRQLYTSWDDRLRQHELDSGQVIVILANKFAEYIGAPSTYKSIDRKKTEEQRYVRPAKATRDENGDVEFSEPEHIYDIVQRDTDGYWISGVRVTLDRAENSYPKKPFTYCIRFALRDRQCEMFPVDDDRSSRFEFNIDDPNGFDEVCKYMLELLQKVLNMQPWGIGEKQPIGFVPPTPQN